MSREHQRAVWVVVKLGDEEAFDASEVQMSGAKISHLRGQIKIAFAPELDHVAPARLKIFRSQADSKDEAKSLRGCDNVPSDHGSTAEQAFFVTCPAKSEAGGDELTQILKGLKLSQEAMQESQAAVKDKVEAMQESQAAMQESQAAMQESQAEVKDKVESMQLSQAEQAKQLENQLEKVEEKVDQVEKKVEKVEEELPEKVVSAQKDVAQMDNASCCSDKHYNSFNFAEQDLDIPLLSQELFSVYETITDSPDFKAKLNAVEKGKEVQTVHPLTTLLLGQRLDKISTDQLGFGTEVGYQSSLYKIKGLIDKAACPEGRTPDSKPSNLDNYHSGILILGSWEDKGLNCELGKKELAQLAASMAGFVDAARETRDLHFKSFGGILVNVTMSDSTKRLTCRCISWQLTDTNAKIWRTSKLLKEEKEVAAAIEWWIAGCQDRLRFVNMVEEFRCQDQKVSRLQPLHPIDEGDSTYDQGGDDVDDEDIGNSGPSSHQRHDNSATDSIGIDQGVSSMRIYLDETVLKSRSHQDQWGKDRSTRCWLLRPG